MQLRPASSRRCTWSGVSEYWPIRGARFVGPQEVNINSRYFPCATKSIGSESLDWAGMVCCEVNTWGMRQAHLNVV